MTERPDPLYFWEFNTARLARSNPQPWIDPQWQQGTTPLVKLMQGKATRDFTNFHHPAIADDDYLGPRAIIVGSFKLVIHETRQGAPRRELFDLRVDPAETTNLFEQQPAIGDKLQTQLRQWQASVLHSLTGADYEP